MPRGVRQALTGVGKRAGERWRTRAARARFPRFPERTRLWRLGQTPPVWPAACWAAPTGLGGMAPDGIERSHPRRAGRRPQQRGRTGLAQHRGMGGGPLA